MGAEAQQLLAHLHGQREAMLDLLERLTRAESPSLDRASQAPVAELLTHELEAVDFRVRRARGRRSGGQLYARPRARRRGVRAQLVLGHCDTVWPVGTLAQMPFAVAGERVSGPGVFDMKGGLVQIVFALRALKETGLAPELTPVVYLNSDEEIGSRDSARHIRLLARRVARAFVLEPALGPEGRLKTARKAVGRFEIVVHGEAAHAGLDPGRGASAILELAYLIQALFALNDGARGISVNVGTVDGGIRPNVVAPRSTALVDVRVQHQADVSRIEAAIRGLAPRTPGVRLEITGGIGRPALEPTPSNRALWQLARQLGGELGLELEQGLAGGGSDGSTTSLFTATLDGLGPVGDGAHAPAEHLLLDRTIERTALLALLLLAPAAPAEVH